MCGRLRSVPAMGVGNVDAAAAGDLVSAVHPVRGRWRMLVVCGAAAGVAQAFGRFSYPVLLPSLREDLLTSYGMAGFIGTLNVGAYLVGSIVVMVVAGRLSSQRLMGIGLTMTTIALVLMATARSVSQLGLGMIIGGLGGAGVWVPAPGVATRLFPPSRRGVTTGASGVGIGIGMFLTSQLARVAPTWWGDESWRVVWWLMAGVALVVAITTWTTLRPPPATGSAAPPTLGALRDVPAWKALSVAYACFGLAYVLYLSYLTSALREDAGFSPGHAANVFGLMAIMTVFGGPALGQVSDRIGRRPTMIAGFAAAAAGSAAILTGQEPFIALGAVVFGLAFSGLVTLIAAYIGDHTSPQQFAAAFGTITVAFALAQAVGPYFGGWLRDRRGDFVAVYGVASAVWVAGGVCCIGLVRAADRRRATGEPASLR